jgi:ketosteroid isomerase-like protein
MEDNDIRQDVTREFVAALRAAEQKGDVEDLVALFSDDAELFRLDGAGTRRGEAQEFWQRYVDQFKEISTQFTYVVEGDGDAGLEWQSTGTLANGRDIDYVGSTFLTFEDGKILGVRTYYDTAAFLEVPASTG